MNNLEIAKKPERRIVSHLFLLCSVFVLVLMPFDLAKSQVPDEKLIVIADVSKSMRGSGLDIVRAALGNVAFNDKIAKNTTVIFYPSGNSFEARNFKNTFEVNNELELLQPRSGIVNLEDIFLSIASNLQNAFKADNYQVLWITDGGFTKPLFTSGNAEDLFSAITLLEKWTIIDTSETSLIRDRLPLDSNIVYIPMLAPNKIFFNEFFTSFREESVSSENSSQSSDFRYSPWAVQVSSVMAFLTFLLLIPVLRFGLDKFESRNILRRRRDALRVQLSALKLQNLSRTNNFRLWSAIPMFLKSNLIKYYSTSDRKGSERRLFTIWIFTGAGMALAAFALSRSIIISMISIIFAPQLTFRQLAQSQEKKALKEFGEELPGLLMLLSSGLKSGLSLEQNLEAYCQQNNNVVAREFRRVITEVRMGNDLHTALKDLSERTKNEDLEWLVTAILIQKEVGGSLSVIIDTVLDTINGRRTIAREVRSLSAEGKLSAYVLIALPIFLFVFLALTQKSYVQNLWTTQIGWLLLSVIFGLISIGWFWMSKVVKIKV